MHSWLDDVGDKMERRGIKLGNILEGNGTPDKKLFQAGFLLATSNREGRIPSTSGNVQELVLLPVGDNAKPHWCSKAEIAKYFHLLKAYIF